ncbi:MAG: FKBP-type peptidyl-prolyl cis-trans isomerase [Porphyromonas sp.]|nr:FKBP-type peptidyl-prolyl cis-trans isomerase [Porphyromonas sp.]
MSKRLVYVLFVLLLGLTGCNVDYKPEDSEYKKENVAFVEEAVNKGYTELRFLNTNPPIYYKVIEASEAANKEYPLQGSTVKMELSGKLISGEIFQAPGPLTMRVNQLILGMQYALQSMNVGDRWEVVIPYELGYGYRNHGTIPAFSTLIFDIQLVEITAR